jgi:hypothetical protein
MGIVLRLHLFVLFSVTFVACTPAPIQQERVLEANSEVETYNSADNIANFLEFGSVANTNVINYPIDLDDSFFIRGSQIDNYITQLSNPLDQNFCLLNRYPQAPNDLLILSAKVKVTLNFTTGENTYYLQVFPNNKNLNTNDCLTTSLVNKMTSLFPSSSLVYSARDICPNGCGRQFGESLALYLPGGSFISEVDLSYLTMVIAPTITTPTQTLTCSSNTTCTALGFQCCSSGQCVNHQQVKNGVDTSSTEYLEAIGILQNNPELINNYSHLFYICNEYITPNDDNNQATDPVEENRELVSELQDLYNCLNPYIDEISICTLEVKNASNQIDTTNGTEFDLLNSDINFVSLNSSLDSNNVFNINYGGELLYQNQLYDTDQVVPLPSSISFSGVNDIPNAASSVTISNTRPASSFNDTLKIRYKVDGSCEKLSANLAKCSKTYVQGQSSTPARPSDHASGNNDFLIPSWVNTGFSVVVEVNGAKVASGANTWSLSGTVVSFDDTNYPIFDNQVVKITYFVTTNVEGLTAAKTAAQDTVDSYCACGQDDCNLRPVFTTRNEQTIIAHYECVYPFDNPLYEPLQETVYLSSKTVPVRFYDENGVHYERDEIQESFIQEGELFEYIGLNTLRPNNQTISRGFNEIYGTMNISDDSPLPPVTIDVVKGKSYDIFTDEGVFSSCLTCGTDFYSNLQRIFPDNFQYKGGGYFPNLVESRRQENRGKYSADDMLFGRACFVPATMIPWTHVEDPDVSDQRRQRQKAQHTLFANGYNRDWYGFDYGSIIGSFDGVKWFAVGNQRRIKADTNKLYLAVNAYFGDVTINNSFKVTVSEINPIIYSGSLVSHDTESDGAQCQQVHFCDTDNDCLTKLGYDYTCENVTQIRTSWPRFDSNANELSGSINTTLSSLVGGSNGEIKRCVYRGRGSLCGPVSSSIDPTTSYSQTAQVALNSCSANNYCATLNSANFNNRIARYANTPRNQNSSQFVDTDTDVVGLSSRLLGRPFQFYGDSTIDSDVRTNLSSNNVWGLCVPGKNIDNSFDIEDLNVRIPIRDNTADSMFGVGATKEYDILSNQNYYAACPAVDDNGNYITRLANSDLALNDPTYQYFATSQNMSTNALFINGWESLNLFNDDDGPIKTQIGYEANSCLRAPGASCFTDLECAPSRFIASKVRTRSILEADLNTAEQAFWEEELVCSTTAQSRYTVQNLQNTNWDLTENRCCREIGKNFTYRTQKEGESTFKVFDPLTYETLVPGINQDIDDPERYSRVHTTFDKVGRSTANLNGASDFRVVEYPPLYTPQERPSTPVDVTKFFTKQYNTLQLNNKRMCCTEHWVRNLSEGANANSGGNRFTRTVHQTIDPTIFERLNWTANTTPPFDRFTCTGSNFDTPDCEIRNIIEGSNYETQWLNWFASLELIGIPQVLVETNEALFPEVDLKPKL